MTAGFSIQEKIKRVTGLIYCSERMLENINEFQRMEEGQEKDEFLLSRVEKLGEEYPEQMTFLTMRLIDNGTIENLKEEIIRKLPDIKQQKKDFEKELEC